MTTTKHLPPAPKPVAQQFPALVPALPSDRAHPPARPARARRRHILLTVSFVGLVLGQVILAAWYLYGRAADQYGSTFGFAVHSESETDGSLLQRVSGLAAISGVQSSDTDILYEYLHSQALVARIDRELDLRTLWAAPENDPVFAFDPAGSIEDLTSYWSRMIRVSYDSGAGIMTIEARAFDPADAQAIAMAIESACSELINRLSAVARQDRLGHAQGELRQAEHRLSDARQALTAFRVRHRLVDPMADLAGEMGVIQELQQALAEELVTLDMLRATIGNGRVGARKGEITDVRITQSELQIEVIRDRIAQERQKFGGEGGSRDYARLMGEFERLRVDVEVAQEAYVVALAAFETARAASDRQVRYLAPYSAPTLPETSRYPDRFVLLAAIAAGLFLLWSVLVLVAYSLRDRT
ncbi:sugar transporter [Roseovarius sp. SCSIO 43702]|uniref:sugar transporter n=1 Tax=Roseovarius sp. SCSIO 43702 TaxID=2823043 RepID=UPI001C73183A|nr:sugar transporter [Roseovarius sp. SCSIO 43702]QYX56872.1 sugar transporter [Roseovarius sp. SCSIO 43702]